MTLSTTRSPIWDAPHFTSHLLSAPTTQSGSPDWSELLQERKGTQTKQGHLRICKAGEEQGRALAVQVDAGYMDGNGRKVSGLGIKKATARILILPLVSRDLGHVF